MFQNLNNIFDSSKIDKKNHKNTSIQIYVNALKKTKENENKKLENFQKIVNEIIDTSKLEVNILTHL
jgi:ribosomal protein S11